MSNVKVHHHKDCECPPVYSGTFEEELAYAEAEVVAAINAERVMEQVVGR